MENGLDILKLAEIIVTAILALIGFLLANNIRRQIQERVTEKRFDAYAALWEKMHIASPTRLANWNRSPLNREERHQLFQDFTRWYYEKGNGMFLGDSTRNLYLIAKDNLICPVNEIQPAMARHKLCGLPLEKQEEERGALSIRQLSLLRSRMKADLTVFGLPYHTRLEEEDIALIKHIGENPNDRPWKYGLPSQASRRDANQNAVLRSQP